MARGPINYEALYNRALGALRTIVAAQADYIATVGEALRDVRDADEAARRAAETDGDTDTGQTECRCPAGEADCAETDTAEAPRLRQWFDPPQAERPCGHSADYTGADCGYSVVHERCRCRSGTADVCGGHTG